MCSMELSTNVHEVLHTSMVAKFVFNLLSLFSKGTPLGSSFDSSCSLFGSSVILMPCNINECYIQMSQIKGNHWYR